MSPPIPRPAPGMPGRAEGDREQRPAATTDLSAEMTKQSVSDSAITTKVKTKLLATKDLKATGIHVKTKNGTVNLSGSVPTKEQHQLAVDTTRSVEGVSSVNDKLKVLSREAATACPGIVGGAGLPERRRLRPRSLYCSLSADARQTVRAGR